MRKPLLLVATLALSSCGKGKSSEATPDCAAAINHAMTLSRDEFKKSGVEDATIPKIRDASIARCQQEKWAANVVTCFNDAKAPDDIDKCQQLMSKEQKDAMAKAITTAMSTQQPDATTGSGSGSAADAGSGSGSAGSGDTSATSGDLPPACADYKALIAKLATCEKLPAASREMMKKSFDAAEQGWKNLDKMPEDAKTALVSGCKQGVDALKQAAGAACGF